MMMRFSASSSGVLAPPPPLQHHCPRRPSQHRCLSHCFGGLSQTPRPLLILNRLGNLHQRSHRPRRHYRGLQAIRHHWRRDLRLGGRLQVLRQTVGCSVRSITNVFMFILTSSAISFFVLIPFARKKFSSGCCSSLKHQVRSAPFETYVRLTD
jgi:hypothetical protein